MMTDWILTSEITNPALDYLVAPGVTGESLCLPVMCFRSGITLPVHQCAADHSRDVVLLGDLEVPVYGTRDQALNVLIHPANDFGYLMQPKGGNRIQLWRGGQSAILLFDNDQSKLVDVQIFEVKAK